jgi:hypothetical protein
VSACISRSLRCRAIAACPQAAARIQAGLSLIFGVDSAQRIVAGAVRLGQGRAQAHATIHTPGVPLTALSLPPQATDPRFRAFFDYWQERAPPGLLPGRQHIDPIDIPALLPGIVLYDVVGDPAGDLAALRFRFRLVGTMMCETVGVDPTGRFLDEMVLTDKKDAVQAAFVSVARDRAAHYWENPLWSADRTYVRLQRLALPLATDGVAVDRIVAYYIRTPTPAPA